jgi:hypothetical protein
MKTTKEYSGILKGTVVFASTGRNNGTAIATTAFSAFLTIPAATMPIFQIIFLVLYLKTENWPRGCFGKQSTAPFRSAAGGELKV